MTKQNVTSSVKVLGFGSDNPSAYPVNRLVSFLNVNPKNASEIEIFCNEYKLILPGEYKDRIANFQSEQEKLKDIVIKSTQDKLSEKEIGVINERLGGIRQQVRLMTEEKILKINKAIPRLEGQFDKTGKQFLVLTKKHANTLSSLWEDFVKYTVSLQHLGQCSNCGQFFTPSQRTGKKQRFCNDFCRDSYHKRK